MAFIISRGLSVTVVKSFPCSSLEADGGCIRWSDGAAGKLCIHHALPRHHAQVWSVTIAHAAVWNPTWQRE